MGYYLPKTMERARRWVLWRLEDGKKKPYSANYNGLASSTRANTWSNYGKALTKLQYTGDEYNGLGFVFAEGDGLVFIDLDKCIDDDGNISEFAESILALFPNCYTEYSQSESGLHILARGTVPRAYKSAEIEIYSSGRYMAFTGNAYNATEPGEAQAGLDELIKRFNITPEAPTVQTPAATISATDETILERATNGRNGESFAKLWAGDWSEYSSQSEADLRLISILYYYSGNADQVERLFINSGLGQRQKGQRSDYIRRTIQKAAENTKPNSASNQQRSGYSRKGLTDYRPKKTSIR